MTGGAFRAHASGMAQETTIPAPVSPRERVRAWRGSRPLWQAGAALGMDPSALKRLETGERKPTLAQALLIRDLVGVDPDEWVSDGGAA